MGLIVIIISQNTGYKSNSQGFFIFPATHRFQEEGPTVPQSFWHTLLVKFPDQTRSGRLVTLKSELEIRKMHEAGRLLAACHREIKRRIRPGVSTLDIDRFVEEYLLKHGAYPEQKGYKGYPFATCASVNDEICHGFPRNHPLNSGDIVTIDMVVNLDGALADSAWTYGVGRISEDARRLMNTTLEALYCGIEKAVPCGWTSDIGTAIESRVESQGFSVVRDFAGHGIGPSIHEKPQILHFRTPFKGTMLKEGMVITIEPMVNAGSPLCTMDENGWTARTVDGSLSVQYEHTVAITASGPLILTQQ